MKRSIMILALVVLSVSIALYGCGAKKAASGSAAIESTKTMNTLDEKVTYLVGQTKAFISSKEYNDAMATARYVLTNLDKNSAEAKKLLDTARKELEAQAKKSVDDMKKKMAELNK